MLDLLNADSPNKGLFRCLIKALLLCLPSLYQCRGNIQHFAHGFDGLVLDLVFAVYDYCGCAANLRLFHALFGLLDLLGNRC